MINTHLKKFNVILASGSPRRHHFFRELGIDFRIEVREVEEVHPPELQGTEITDYLAKLKASAFEDLSEKDLIITLSLIHI